MKKKIFIGAAAMVLGVSAFLTVKAARFASYVTAATKGGALMIKTVNGGQAFTTATTGRTIVLVIGGVQKTLVTTTAFNKRLYLK